MTVKKFLDGLQNEGNMSTLLSSVTEPPGRPGIAYTLESLGGEVIYIPCSKSAMRLLATGKETENAFAIVGTGGSAGHPIGFHFHREAHDVFLCLKGAVNVWAGDQCRTMGPGDFASVPPVSKESPSDHHRICDADLFRAQYTNTRLSASTPSSWD